MQNRLDVFAGSERVRGEIRALAEVRPLPQRTDLDPVRPRGGPVRTDGVGDPGSEHLVGGLPFDLDLAFSALPSVRDGAFGGALELLFPGGAAGVPGEQGGDGVSARLFVGGGTPAIGPDSVLFVEFDLDGLGTVEFLVVDARPDGSARAVQFEVRDTLVLEQGDALPDGLVGRHLANAVQVELATVGSVGLRGVGGFHGRVPVGRSTEARFPVS